MTISSLGRYQIVAQLGRGATCTVYRALDPKLERSVAIKILNSDLPAENLLEVKARFVLEAKAAGMLNHANLVTVYDVGVVGDIAYISMEYIEGQSLRQLLDSGAPTPFGLIADLLAQIADGLDYAHNAGVVHRDIKPANIMILPAGQAKLTDFGVAHVQASSLTRTGTVPGSPKYMSPEQVNGQTVDGRSDIFSLGVVLHEMLTRKTPFDLPDISLFALMQRIVSEPVPRISERDREVPAGFDAILERALAKRMEDRYERASEFASDLRNYKALRPRGADAMAVKPGQAAPGSPDPSRLPAEAAESPQPTAAAPTSQAQALNARLRYTFDYLQSLVRQFNGAMPPFTVTLDLIHIDKLPAATLGNGIVECHTKKIEAQEVVDYIALTYRMSLAKKVEIKVGKDDAPMLKRQLEQARVPFDHRDGRSDSDAQKRETFSIDSVVPATAIFRCDYGSHTLEIQCHNVGMLGVAIYRFSIADLDDRTVRDFGNIVLGLPNELAGFRQASGK